MNVKKALVTIASLLAGAAIFTPAEQAEAGRTHVLVVNDNQLKERVTCEVYRVDNDERIATLRYRAKSKYGRVFRQPNDKATVYLKCGPGDERKKMRLKYDTANAKTHRITVACYNPGGCIANQRRNPKPKGGRA